MTTADKSMGLALRAVRTLAESDLLDRVGLRKQVEKALYNGTRDGFRVAGAAGRTFAAAQKLGRPARQKKAKPRELFDVTPDDDQQMLVEVTKQFAAEAVRPVAQEADHKSETPKELLEQAAELGVTILGVPESLGGVVAERSAVTSVLIAEALGHGDIGIAVSILAPGAVPTALGLWGDAEQQAKYLPAFTEDNAPAAALAIVEPRPLFNPLKLDTTAKKDGTGFVLNGVKSMVPRAKDDELFIVAAELDGSGPALFLVESKTEGVFTEPEPAMGLRAAETGRLILENVKVPALALLGGGDLAVYEECIHRSRIAWCALATGAAQAALDYLIPYVNTREAFGEPISHRQSVAFTISDIGIETDAMRLLTYRAASRADMGRTFAREAALARRLCADKGMKIGSDSVQLLGGHGYIKEHPAERWYRDLRAVGVMEGALLV